MERLSRRRAVRLGGSVLAVGLAGCGESENGDGDEEDEGGDEEDEDGDEDDGGAY